MRYWVGLCLMLVVGLAGAQTLRIGFGTDKPPYVIEAEKRGLEVDIVLESTRLAGYAVEPFFAPMERLHHMLARGELDGIATTNPRSGLRVFYSRPYIEYHNVAVALASRKLEIKRIDDLGRYSVSAFQRARQLLGPEFELMALHNPNYREEPHQVTRNRLLFAGRVDVIVGDRRIIEYFTTQVGGEVNVRQALSWFELFPPTAYHVAFLSDNVRSRFDEGLETLRKRGDYLAIEKRYRGPAAK